MKGEITVEGRICGFRRSRRSVDTRFCIVESREAALEQIIGKKVFWKSAKGRLFRGRVLKQHGREAFLCRFERAIPADALGATIAIGRIIPAEKPKKAAKPKKEKAAKAKEEKPKKVAKKPVKKAKATKKKAKPKKKTKAAPKKAVAKKPMKKAAKAAKKKAKPAKKKAAKKKK